MNEGARYTKIVEWSEEDQCFIGSVPGLIYGGCHGTDEKAVFDELCRIVEETVALYHQDGKPLPPRTSTYKAILKGDQLEWREEKPETVADRDLVVIVTILDEPSSSGEGARMASALERLAASGGPGIDDPLEWQRQSRLNPSSET